MDLKNRIKKYAGKSKKGFTVIEMLAVVAIIAIASTATISVFIAVQQTVRDTGTITSEQFTTSQIEKFIRNEFQVASNVDVLPLAGTSPSFSVLGSSYTSEENDEYLYYDSTLEKLYFMKCDSTGTFKGVLTIDDVQSVIIDICPIDYAKGQAGGETAKNMPLKMVYNIITTNYTYSGGIVLGNTKTGVTGNMSYCDPATYSVTVDWGASGTSNNYAIIFHSETATEVSIP